LVNDLTIEISDLPIISNRNNAIPSLLEYAIGDENACQAFMLIQSIEEDQVIIDDITYVLSPETVLVWVNDETTVFYVVAGNAVVVRGDEVFYIPEGAKLSKVTSDEEIITYEEVPYSDVDITAFGLSDEIIVADPIDEDALRDFIIQSRPAPATPIVTQNTQTNTTETEGDTVTAPPPPTSGLVGRRVVSNFSTGFSITSIPGAGSEAVIGQVPVGTGGLVIESSFVGCCNFINVQWDTGQVGWVYDQWVALEE
jgi:hypothetical protein